MGRRKGYTRESVLAKALPVFWRLGFAHTAMQDLEVATGVNKSGLYAEFVSKDELFLACLERYLGARGGTILIAEPLGWKNIERYLSFAADGKNGGITGCFSINTIGELASLPPVAAKMIEESRRDLRAMLKKNVEAANPALDADEACDVVMTFFSGLSVEAHLRRGRSRREEIARFIRMIDR
jgi:AcrR family transcriptional regulator